MSVSAVPGASAFTRIPSGADSRGHRAGERHHSRLGGGVHRDVGGEQERTRGDHVDHGRVLARLEVRQRRLDQEDRTPQVHVERLLPRLGRELARAAASARWRRCSPRCRHRRTARRCGRRARAKSSSSPVCVATPSASPPIAVRCASVSAQASALRLATTTLAPAAHETLGHGPADAAGAAGDDRDPTAQVEQGLQLPLVHGPGIYVRGWRHQRCSGGCDGRRAGRSCVRGTRTTLSAPAWRPRSRDSRTRFPRYPKRYLYILMAVGAVDAADRTILATVIEDIRRAFDVSDSQIGWLIGAYGVVAALSVLPFGWLADRWNRVWLIALGFIPWSIAMFWAGAAQSFTMMFAARMFLGSIEATNGPSTPSLLGDYYPVKERGRVFGIYGIGALDRHADGLRTRGRARDPLRLADGLLRLGRARDRVRHRGVAPAPRAAAWHPGRARRCRNRSRRARQRRGRRARSGRGLPPRTNRSRPTAIATTATSRCGKPIREIARVRTMWITFVAGFAGEFFFSAIASWAPTFFRRYHGFSAAGAGSLVALLALSVVGGIVVGGRFSDRQLAAGHPARRIRMAGLADIAAVFNAPHLVRVRQLAGDRAAVHRIGLPHRHTDGTALGRRARHHGPSSARPGCRRSARYYASAPWRSRRSCSGTCPTNTGSAPRCSRSRPCWASAD